MAKLTTICAYCKKIMYIIEYPERKEDATSHGMCPACAIIENAKIDKYIKEKQS